MAAKAPRMTTRSMRASQPAIIGSAYPTKLGDAGRTLATREPVVVRTGEGLKPWSRLLVVVTTAYPSGAAPVALR
jgi:hypothetical protein